ncbi:MAG: hypothetical protein LBD77_06565 [Bifidobacteriaceae bacterium]|nr:hypothetical protein [Bifidobacteriaceae bacterium]
MAPTPPGATQLAPTAAGAQFAAAATFSAPRTFAAPVAAPPPPPVKPRTPPIALVALAAAAAGTGFACFPSQLMAVGWVMLPVALVLAIIGRAQAGRQWPANAAAVLAVVGAVAGFVAFKAATDQAIVDSFQDPPATVTLPDGSAAPEGVGTRDSPAPLGAIIARESMTVVINSVILNATDQVVALNPRNPAPQAGQAYAIVNVTVDYTWGETEFDIADLGLAFVPEDGEVMTDFDALAIWEEPAPGLHQALRDIYEVSPATGNAVLAVPLQAEGVLAVRVGMFAKEVYVAVDQ